MFKEASGMVLGGFGGVFVDFEGRMVGCGKIVGRFLGGFREDFGRIFLRWLHAACVQSFDNKSARKILVGEILIRATNKKSMERY